MLLGQNDGRVGEKFRVAFPKRFREELGERLIVTKGFETCLIIVSEKSWTQLLSGTEGQPFTKKATRELERFLLGNATEVELDTKGRFIIPEFLRTFAGITEEIVFVGVSRYVELWDKTYWNKHQTMLSKDIETIAEKLSENDGHK